MCANDDGKKAALELHKMEYEKGATRYEDIYKASWTNFSYLAAVSGAILAFGGDKLGMEVAGILASVPLLFWYWATFEPLTTYGDEVESRLKSIESTLNEKSQLIAAGKPDSGLHLYTGFADRGGKKWGKQYVKCTVIILLILPLILIVAVAAGLVCHGCEVWKGNILQKPFWFLIIIILSVILGGLCQWQKKLRVRYVMRFFFYTLHITVAALLLIHFYGNTQKDEVKSVTITLKDDKGEVKLTEIELEKLKELLESLRK